MILLLSYTKVFFLLILSENNETRLSILIFYHLSASTSELLSMSFSLNFSLLCMLLIFPMFCFI